MKLYCFILLFTLSFSTACNPTGENQSKKKKAVKGTTADLPRFIVDMSWLKKNDDKNLLLIDARPSEAYKKGHIPGAVSVPDKSLNGKIVGSKQILKPVRELNKLLGEIGIDGNRNVVIYGDQFYRKAAHIFWTLELHGHSNVAVLDGGVEGWLKSGGKLETKLIKPESRHFTSKFSPARVADKLEMRRALSDPNSIVIDSRKKSEYEGLESKGKRKGHITTAIFLPVTGAYQTVDDVCNLYDLEQLKRTYGGLDRTKKIFIYCNGGRDSTVNYMVLRMLNYNVAVYDGSWLEWSKYDKLPITKGMSPGGLK
jgi:thiosulfate/3-mercaptopyruvate sulfurtransferase